MRENKAYIYISEEDPELFDSFADIIANTYGNFRDTERQAKFSYYGNHKYMFELPADEVEASNLFRWFSEKVNADKRTDLVLVLVSVYDNTMKKAVNISSVSVGEAYPWAKFTEQMEKRYELLTTNS